LKRKANNRPERKVNGYFLPLTKENYDLSWFLQISKRQDRFIVWALFLVGDGIAANI
jgi:hypothetical protein